MRQAIVIIHGMGEQKPMASLRGFIDTLVAYDRHKKNKREELSSDKREYWSKPDNISNSYELRRLVLAGGDERPTTDLFEYYWAYNMRDTTTGHIIPWFRFLLLRWPWKVPARLLFIWIVSWILTISILFGFVLFFVDDKQMALGLLGFDTSGTSSSGDQFEGNLLTFIFTFVLIFMQRILVGSIGDAARYLTPSPANISERHNIRKNGVDLLLKLHEAKDNNKQIYDRIVVVGHSLGSVIGLDIITHLWPMFNQRYDIKETIDPAIFDELKKRAEALKAAIDANKKDEEKISRLISEFQHQQIKVGKAMRKAKNPWLITDFVTLGSPLSHGAFLMARNEKDFSNRKNDRELLTCPPTEDNGKYYFQFGKDPNHYLHHAAAFAPTVWTNIYFPGDIIGGELSTSFGSGIKDVKVEYAGFFKKWISRISIFTHTKYWRNEIVPTQINTYKALFDAVDLNNLKQTAHRSENEQAAK